VVVYDAEVRVAGLWTHAPRLMVRLDRAEPCELVELAWRSEGGAEATIVFEDGMRAFRGHRRDIDGSPQEYRGTESGRRPGPGEMADLRERVFATEEFRKNEKVIGGELRLVLDDGGAPVERVTWRDRQGTFISVALRTVPAIRSTVPVAVDEVVASDENREAAEGAENLLRFGPDKWLASQSTATPDFVLSEPAVVTAYRLTAGNDHRERDPRDWRLRGLMDGSAWFTLDARVGQSFPERSKKRECAVVNSTAYRLYRLDVGRNRGGLPETQLNRVELLSTDETGLIGTAVPVSRVAASDEYRYAGEVADNALHTGEGKWLARWTPAWLEFFLPEPAAVTAYTLTSADDHVARDPKDWVLQGSLDGDSWVTLDQRAGETFSERFLVREFTMANATAYPRYRLHVTANDGAVREVQLNRVQLLVKNDDRYPALGEFFGVLRRSDGTAADYLGKGIVEITDPREPGAAGGRVVEYPAPPQADHEAVMTAPCPDFDTTMAQGAVHRYAGGETAVIRVLTEATLTLTSGHVTFDDPYVPLSDHQCPLRRGLLPDTPPVPPGRYWVHLIVADITDADGGPEVTSKVAAVRLVVRDEPAVAWDIHEDYPDGLLAPPSGQHRGDIIVGLTDCQTCGTYDYRNVVNVASYVGDQAVSYPASNTDDWFCSEASQDDSTYLEDNGFPPEPVRDAMVLLPTGWAPGHYRTWAGRGADGGLVCLLTDFEVLSDNVGPDPRRRP
jgi:hypothetical protein